MLKNLSKFASWLLLFASWLILCVMVASKALQIPIISDVSFKVFDMYQRLAPRPYEAAGTRIIDIDDDSLAKLGQWPWSRQVVAELTRKLHEAGAAVVAYDILFPEPDRTAPKQIIPLWKQPELNRMIQTLPDPDSVLADTIAQGNNVTASMFSNHTQHAHEYNKSSIIVRGDIPEGAIPEFEGMIGSLPALSDAAAGEGSVNNIPDRDGIIRRVPLILKYNEQLYPTLAIESLRVAMGLSSYVVNAGNGLESVKLGDFTIPVDRNGMMWLYYTETTPDRYIPAWKIMDGSVPKEQLEGHIIFIGTSAAGLKDLRATPFYPDLPGVEVHAQAVEQILLGKYLERPDWMFGAEVLVMVALGLLTLLIAARTKALVGFGTMLLLAGGTIAFSWWAFREHAVLIEPVTTVMTITLVYVVESVRRFLNTEQERKFIRDAFSLYLSPALVEKAVAHPEKLKLGGENRELTILFMDVRDFSAYSERQTPEELTQFINDFLTPMTDIIMAHQGTVDKYIGDCIMAFWNAPLDDAQHATHAAQALLAMRTRLHAFNAALEESNPNRRVQLPPVRVGMGLNSGLCCVGNLGSTMRFNYSALGNAVDISSRLEGQSKLYGVDNVIGESTMAQMQGTFTLELDRIQVKGKKQALTIYTIMGDDTLGETPEAAVLHKAHEALLSHYRAQRWATALQAANDAKRALKALLHAHPHTPDIAKLYDVYESRIAEYQKAPPPTEWDGVYVATFK